MILLSKANVVSERWEKMLQEIEELEAEAERVAEEARVLVGEVPF